MVPLFFSLTRRGQDVNLESQCSCCLYQADFLCLMCFRKERRSGAQDSDAKSCFCSASGQASVKLGLLCRWNRIVVSKIWYKDLQRDLRYRCQFQISSFPVSALVVSQMRKYSWIHQTKSCISEECFTQPMYIFVHIWEDGGALSFRKSSLLLASISWSVITLTKHFAFCSGCYICDKVLIVAVVADAYLGFWSSDTIKRLGKLMVYRSFGQCEPSVPKQHNVSADGFHNSTPFLAPFS